MKQLAAILFIIIIIVLCVATFVEQAHGTAFATHYIYHSWWFFAIWAMLAAISVAIIIKKRLWQRPPVLLIHLALLIILLGAATTFMTSQSGMLHIREGNTENLYLDDSYQMHPLPFSLRLDSFRIAYYPGTDTPADYISYVTLTPTPQHQTLNTKHSTLNTKHSTLISMNSPLLVDGYRLYQSSYDEDCRGTILSVKYDRMGTPITYIGYILMAVGMIWTLMSGKGRFRRLLREAMSGRALVTYIIFIYGVTSVSARTLPTINNDKAQQMARRQIVYNGRIAPFNTMANDFMLKIYGKTTYHGLSAEQIVCGWMARPEVWKSEPMIEIDNAELRAQLKTNGRYIALQSLFNKDGSYKLQDSANARQGRLPSKAIQALDEKVGIIIMLTQGTLFTPVPKVYSPLSHARIEAEILYNQLPIVKLLFIFNITTGILLLILFMTGYKVMKIQNYVLYASLLTLTLFYALRWYVSGRIPLSNGYETMLFMSLMIMLSSSVIGKRFHPITCMGLILSGFTLLVAHLGDKNPQITHLMPVLNSPLLSIHVSVIMMAYALLSMTFIIAIISLLTPHSTLNTNPSTLNIQHSLTLLSSLLLYPAVFLLAIGIFLGAVWANISWGTYWNWDPKEVWALITMLIYAIPLHIPSLNTKHSTLNTHFFMLFAFLTVLMTYFGVNYFLGGMHSYA